MKKLIHIAILFSFSVLVSSCRKGTVDVVKTINTGKFNTISIEETCTIYLVSDTNCSVELRGPSDWVEHSGISVTDSVLKIAPSHHGEFLHPSKELVTVYIHYDSLKRINTEESCTIRTSNPLKGHEIGLVSSSHTADVDLELACDIFYFWNYPNGTHMNLRGSVSQLKLWNTGLTSIDAGNVSADYVLVENVSQGDIHVSPIQTLDYSIKNKGNIYYSGSPATIIQQTCTGTGRLIQE